MTLAITLTEFQTSVSQVDSLIANAHQSINGSYFLPTLDREQITSAAFLNMFIAWEGFLESSITKFMAGTPTISGTQLTRYVMPPSIETAKAMIIGINRYFDYANIDNVKKVVNQYFANGYPFEPHLAGISRDIIDLRIIRNAAAHISVSTQIPLDTLAQRLLNTPHPNITTYQLITAQPPNTPTGSTVLSQYRDKLLVTANLIAQG